MARVLSGNSGDYLTRADQTELRIAFPLTVAFWFKGTSHSNFTYLLSKLLLAGDHPSYGFSFSGAGELRFIVGTGTGASAFVATSTTAGSGNVYDGAWHHVAGTYDGTTVTCYVDGVSMGTVANTAAVSYAALALYVGSFDGSILSAAGTIAEISLWSAALSTDDMASLARAIAAPLVRPDQLAAYWPLLGVFSPEVESVKAMDLTINGAATIGAEHVRIYYPTSSGARRLTTASGGGTTNAPAESTAVTVAANDASATVAPAAQSTAVTVTANDATAITAPAAQSTAVAAAANDASAAIAPTAEATAVTAAANDATATVAPSAESTAVTATSYDATAAVGAAGALSSVAVAAGDPTAVVAVSAECATVAVSAPDPSIAGNTAAPAECATVAGSAGDASATVAVSVGCAAVAVSALDASSLVLAGAGCAAVSVTAHDPLFGLPPGPDVDLIASEPRIGWTSRNARTAWAIAPAGSGWTAGRPLS